MSAMRKLPDSHPTGRLRPPSYAIAGLAGTSFKHAHLPAILAEGTRDGFFEVHAENYMGPAARLIMRLNKSAATIPSPCTALPCRSVVRSLSTDIHLERFRALAERYEPAVVSEHLAWSTHETTYFNDLLPLPYTEATLSRVSEHVDEVQQAIRRPILLENPSTYVVFRESAMSEMDFIRGIVQRTGCGLLLDLNNVFVSATQPWLLGARLSLRFPDGACRRDSSGRTCRAGRRRRRSPAHRQS